MKLWHLIAAAAIFAALFGGYYFLGGHSGGVPSGMTSEVAWARMARPGDLSKSHAFLEHNCAACHTAGKGVEASSCIACHANNETLLQRQPTAFHANVSSCVECHAEHRGLDRRPTDMDHGALTKIGFRQLKADPTPGGENERVRKDLIDWIGQHRSAGRGPAGHSSLTPQEAVLNCASCHSTKDRHRGLFGTDCAQCHTAAKWTISAFRHPSPKSTNCAQCHQATTCHYMPMCFQMMAKVARQPTAKVNQCYQCHQTTAWTDIKGGVEAMT